MKYVCRKYIFQMYRYKKKNRPEDLRFASNHFRNDLYYYITAKNDSLSKNLNICLKKKESDNGKSYGVFFLPKIVSSIIVLYSINATFSKEHKTT